MNDQSSQPTIAPSVEEPSADIGAWWMVTVLLIFYIVAHVDRTIIVLMVEPIKRDLGLSDFEISFILGPAFGIFMSLFSVPAGWAADRWSRRWVILIGIILWSLMTAICGLATSFITLFFARAMVAIGEATLTPAAYSLLTDRFPKRRLASALAVYNMGPKGGQSLAYFIGAIAMVAATAFIQADVPFLNSLEPWQVTFFLVGAPGLGIAFLALSFPEPPRGGSEQRSSPAPPAIPFLLEHKHVFFPLFLGFCLVNIGAGAVTVWTPSYVIRTFGWTAAQLGPVMGLVAAIAALCLIPKGMIVDWLYARGMRDAALRFYTWVLLIFLPLGPTIYFLRDPLWFFIGYGALLVVVLSFMIYAAATLQLITPPRLRGRATGLLITILAIFSQTLGPTLTAALTDFVFKDPQKLGYSLALVVTSGMLGSLIVLRYTLRVIQPMLPPPEESNTQVSE